MKCRFKVLSSCLLMGFIHSAYGIRVLEMAEFKRIEVSVSQDRINRISVLGDRIVQIFGDEGRFTVEQDEVNGQAFLKVQGSSTESISLSIVTESGKTQDLLLNPKKGLSDPIVLKGSKLVSVPFSPFNEFSSFSSLNRNDRSLETLFARILRESVQGRLDEITVSVDTKRSNPPGVTLTFERALSAAPYVCLVYVISNQTSTVLELDIPGFSEFQDEALGFSATTLEKDGTGKLYVIRRKSTMINQNDFDV